MNMLPCLEDLRQATFASFEAKPDLEPEERHIAAMTTLIDDMDLSGVRPCAPCGTCSSQRPVAASSATSDIVAGMPCMLRGRRSDMYRTQPVLQVSGSQRT